MNVQVRKLKLYNNTIRPKLIFFPVPPPKFYVQVNPIQISFDVVTLLWFNSFALNLYQSILASRKDTNSGNYVDVKIEAIMPRVSMLCLHIFMVETVTYSSVDIFFFFME